MSHQDKEKPDYVIALEAAYGPPSQEGFGSAVFFDAIDPAQATTGLEAAARRYYRYFVGDLWERWGEGVWMAPWKEVYVRPPGAEHDVAQELRDIDDRTASTSVPIILEVVANADKAVQALAAAYNVPDVADFRVYTIGDGEAMSGLLLAGRRENGEATFLAFLMD